MDVDQFFAKNVAHILVVCFFSCVCVLRTLCSIWQFCVHKATSETFQFFSNRKRISVCKQRFIVQLVSFKSFMCFVRTFLFVFRVQFCESNEHNKGKEVRNIQPNTWFFNRTTLYTVLYFKVFLFERRIRIHTPQTHKSFFTSLDWIMPIEFCPFFFLFSFRFEIRKKKKWTQKCPGRMSVAEECMFGMDYVFHCTQNVLRTR